MWENNLNAPRFRPDNGRVYLNNLQMAIDFIKANPDLGFTTPEQVLEVLKDVHLEIRNIAQNERDGFEIPYLGVLRHSAIACTKLTKVCTTGKVKEQLIDYATSKKLKKIVKFTNFDTDGKILNIDLEYALVKYKIPFREFWCFKACRDYRRTASKAFKTNYLKLTQK
jgi:hypothetical protein